MNSPLNTPRENMVKLYQVQCFKESLSMWLLPESGEMLLQRLCSQTLSELDIRIDSEWKEHSVKMQLPLLCL